ncbi:MAG: hypothetical protein KDD76_00505 [Rickettsiales bacterium]|nr:hypothetical protein [Rickettsiales bacterium]
MAKKPAYTTTYKTTPGGARIFEKDTRLKQKMGNQNVEALLSPERVEKAKTAIAKREDNFTQELEEQVHNIERYLSQLRTAEEKHEADIAVHSMRQIKDMVLNIKGQSAMYGYNLAGDVARFLFEYLMQHNELTPKLLKIIQVHVDALHVICHREMKGNGGELGKQLVKELTTLTGIK